MPTSTSITAKMTALCHTPTSPQIHFPCSAAQTPFSAPVAGKTAASKTRKKIPDADSFSLSSFCAPLSPLL